MKKEEYTEWWQMLLWDELDATWELLSDELKQKIKNAGLRTKA